MIRFFRYLGWTLTLLPKRIELVRAIEAFAPMAQQGKYKLELVRGIVADLWNQAKGDDDKLSLEETLSLATLLVNRLVGFFNATGIFQK